MCVFCARNSPRIISRCYGDHEEYFIIWKNIHIHIYDSSWTSWVKWGTVWSNSAPLRSSRIPNRNHCPIIAVIPPSFPVWPRRWYGSKLNNIRWKFTRILSISCRESQANCSLVPRINRADRICGRKNGEKLKGELCDCRVSLSGELMPRVSLRI